MFALTIAMGASGEWNIDIVALRARGPAADGLPVKTYYELWLAGSSGCSTERGVLARPPGRVWPRPTCRPCSRAAARWSGRRRGRRGSRSATTCARARSTRAVTRGCPVTRVGAQGVIERVHGCHVFPDSNAHGRGEDPQWLYSVRLGAVNFDAFEPYLEPA